MELKLKTINNNLIVKLNGELDHHTSEEVRQKIDDFFMARSLKNIVMDFNDLKFMDSSGIGLIIGRYKLVKDRKGTVKITNVDARLKKMMIMSGIQKIAKFYDTLDDACQNNEE
ncbi:anti-sigma F factor antagonist [Abyssisolibacter fermentans]|uniref:anti-sigma F factor antagonist n=1 Tax=Abyssisolibacter fermentans TaxID=1766203 RepID=UPI000830F085|nr:anti-sigma F factor antagonist [Abyssisolibacter fermentans]